ncbi:MAG: ATP-binding protein [Chitinophagaceae bacterium]
MSNKKYNGWQNFPTIQFKEIISELADAKEEPKALMLIADTGLGKSNAIKAFTTKKPVNVFVFTLGDSYNLIMLLNEICTALGIPPYSIGTKNFKCLALRRISDKLNELGSEGRSPVIILDESENARIPVLKFSKELYDAVIENCSIVLIGTIQLIGQLNKKSQSQSIPQLRRRFKAGTRFITPFNKVKDMKPFFEAYIPDQPDVQDLLIQLCDNYGELHDYLHPFLVHCSKKNIEPTEAAFRLFHKIPKHK